MLMVYWGTPLTTLIGTSSHLLSFQIIQSKFSYHKAAEKQRNTWDLLPNAIQTLQKAVEKNPNPHSFR